MTDNTPAAISDDFLAAKGVFDSLKDLPKPTQERVIRWVTERLGIALTAAETPTPPPPPPPPSATPPPAHRIPHADIGTVDIATFIKEKKPQSDIQFVTAVAFYYRFVAPEADRRATIDALFAQNATRTGGWDRLKKPLQTLNNAKGKGYLDSASRGEFKINTVGENLIDRTLPLDVASPDRQKSVKKPGVKKPATKRGKSASARRAK